jgi:DHA1 family tetracycline resistance protein-like MFS transporter
MKNISRFRKDIILLFIAELLWPLGLALYANFLPIDIKERGGSDFVVSVIMSIPNILGVLAILGGILCDITDKKYVIIFGWAITIPVPLIWAFTSGWEWILLGQIIHSFTWVCAPAITLYILDYNTTANKMTGYTLVHLAAPLGSIIAPSIGGKLISLYGKQVLYLVVFILYSVSTLCTFLLTKQPSKKQKLLKGGLNPKSYVNLPTLKSLVPITLFFIFLAMFQNIGEPYLPLFMNEFRQTSIVWIGFYYTALFTGASIFTAIFGRASEKANSRLIISLGNVLFVVSILFLLLPINSLFLPFIAFFLRGTNRSIPILIQAIFAKNIINNNNKGFILSLFIAIRFMVIGLAVYPGAFLFHSNPKYPFYLESILVIVWILFSYNSYFKDYFKTT